MVFKKVNIFLLIAVTAIICLNLTREHWQNFNNYELGKNITFYDKFYIFLSDEIERTKSDGELVSRTYDPNEVQLEQREKTRWIFLNFINSSISFIKKISDSQNYFDKKKLALYLYSFFIGIAFFLIYLALLLFLINLSKKYSEKEISIDEIFNITLFVSFTYFTLITYINLGHFRGGEDNFSIFETLAMVVGILLIFSEKRFFIIFYIIICSVSPLIRESGIMISGFYILYHLIKNKKINLFGFILPFISITPYSIANYDLFKFYTTDGFILTTTPIQSQTTWDNFNTNFVGFMHAIFYNFVIFFIPIIIFFKRKNKLQLFFLIFILLYFLLLSFGSVLDHISTRFMPGCLIIIYSFIGIKNINFNKH